MAAERRKSEGRGAETADLQAREYRDEQGNIHHHTKSYMSRRKPAARRSRKAGSEPGRSAGARPGSDEAMAGQPRRTPQNAGSLLRMDRVLIVLAAAGLAGFGFSRLATGRRRGNAGSRRNPQPMPQRTAPDNGVAASGQADPR